MEKIKKIKTLEDFIINANITHGGKFNYSKSEYKGSKEKITIICPEGHEFMQTPNDHLNRHGCKICSGWGQMMNHKKFIKKLKNIYNDKYDFSESVYNGWEKTFKIKCDIHGDIDVLPSQFIVKKTGCPKCGYDNKYHPSTMSLEEFILKAKSIHSDKYDYSQSIYKSASTKVEIMCPKHGPFKQMPKDHIYQKQGCPSCYSSKGEDKIRDFLESNSIPFIPQYKFEECKNKRPLPFDFYLPDYNICIEFDGIQHYSPIKIFGGAKHFTYIKYKDEIKNNFCTKNKIKLIRIRYDQVNELNNILVNKLNLNNK